MIEMIISTRGRYALRVLIDLAEHYNGGFTPMKEVAERQDISLKYLERIIPALTKGGLIEGVHGKGGGYRLTRSPDEYNVWDVLVLTETELAPVACLEDHAKPCVRQAECRTLPLWQEFYENMKDFFKSKSIADLMQYSPSDNYVI